MCGFAYALAHRQSSPQYVSESWQQTGRGACCSSSLQCGRLLPSLSSFVNCCCQVSWLCLYRFPVLTSRHAKTTLNRSLNCYFLISSCDAFFVYLHAKQWNFLKSLRTEVVWGFDPISYQMKLLLSRVCVCGGVILKLSQKQKKTDMLLTNLTAYKLFFISTFKLYNFKFCVY